MIFYDNSGAILLVCDCGRTQYLSEISRQCPACGLRNELLKVSCANADHNSDAGCCNPDCFKSKAYETKSSMRETDWGRLLVKFNMEPYDTESSARRVAERSTQLLRDIYLLSQTVGGGEEIERRLREIFAWH